MFPFEFQGLIIPYEPRPNLKLILSCEPFLIGLEYEAYDIIKEDIGKQTVLIYDLDEKEFLTNMGVSKMSVRINKELPSKRK